MSYWHHNFEEAHYGLKAILIAAVAVLVFGAAIAQAQDARTPTTTATTTEDGGLIQEIPLPSTLSPVEFHERGTAQQIFSRRPAERFALVNGIAFAVQSAVRKGVPADTVALILLLPFLATFVAFVRNIVGLPSLDMLVPIMFSIALLATGIAVGVMLLVAMVLSSIAARVLFKRIRIMQLPKLALSLLLVAIGVFAALVVSTMIGALDVRAISIVPILLLIVLSERLTKVQLERSPRDTIAIVGTTLALGLAGFLVLAALSVRQFILVYPEVLLLLVPANILIGRYFGLRLTEYVRFAPITGAAR